MASIAREGNSSNAELVCFVHVPKCGGTSLLRVILRHYGRDRVCLWRPKLGFAENLGILQDRRPLARALTGHLGFGIDAHVDRPVRYLTMLRHPVDLVVSRYEYRRRRTQRGRDPLQDHARGLTLASFASQIEDNPMVRFLSGLALEEQLALAPEGKASFETLQRAHADASGDWPRCTEAHLAKARDHLERRFDAFGLSSRFDESLLLLGAAFGWSSLAYTRENVGVRRAPPSDEERELLLDRNRLDLALYEEAEKLFDARIARAGARLARRLARFRRWNRVIGPWRRRSDRLRERLGRRLARLRRD